VIDKILLNNLIRAAMLIVIVIMQTHLSSLDDEPRNIHYFADFEGTTSTDCGRRRKVAKNARNVELLATYSIYNGALTTAAFTIT